jgi:hypothetical protein
MNILNSRFHVKHFLFFYLFVPLISKAQSYSITLQQKSIPYPTVIDTSVENWDKSFTEYHLLAKDVQVLLYWTNYSRHNPKRFWDSVVSPIVKALPELNGESSSSLQKDLYKTQSLPLFNLNNLLVKMAQFHANEIGIKQLPISHDSPDGTNFAHRFSKFGLKNCGAENINTSDDVLLGLVLLYIDYNMTEAGHRKNLLSQQFTDIGIGICNYGKSGNQFCVQDFSCPQ